MKTHAGERMWIAEYVGDFHLVDGMEPSGDRRVPVYSTACQRLVRGTDGLRIRFWRVGRGPSHGCHHCRMAGGVLR